MIGAGSLPALRRSGVLDSLGLHGKENYCVAMRMDPYVSKTLRVAYKRGIADYAVGVYQIVVGTAGLIGCLLVWIARHAMLNRSAKDYLIAKKQLPPKQERGPIFVTLAEHPHKRTDLKLPEWRPLETPSTLQDRRNP